MKASLQALPFEILHQIFDHLDYETIRISIRRACKWLYQATNTYNNYRLDFRYMSRSNLGLIARTINPTNIISLTLSDEPNTPNQIRLFLTHFQLNRFIRLHELKLVEVSQRDLQTFQQYIIECCLETLSITAGLECYRTRRVPTPSITINSDLRKFEWIGDHKIFNSLNCFGQCTLEHVTITNCYWSTVYNILTYSSNLQTLILKNIHWKYFDSTEIAHRVMLNSNKLTELSLNIDHDISMNDIETLLSLLPTLKHFQLTGNTELMDHQFCSGSRWEIFIREKLPLLNNFEFSFVYLVQTDTNGITADLLITPFRTSFWLNEKHWIVKCDYVCYEYRRMFKVYSIPSFQDNFNYSKQKNVLDSVINVAQNNIPTLFNVQDLTIELNAVMTDKLLYRVDARTTFIFPKVKQLTLEVGENWFVNSIKTLSAIIDLSSVEILWLNFQCECMFATNFDVEMATFFERVPQLRSIRISCSQSERMKIITFNDICLKLPSHIKHLDTDITYCDDAKLIFERLKHLSSVTFRTTKAQSFAHEIDKWFWQLNIVVSYQVKPITKALFDESIPNDPIHYWLGEIIRKQSNHKRLKLSND